MTADISGVVSAAPLAHVEVSGSKRSILEIVRRLRIDLTVLFESEAMYREDVIVRKSLMNTFVIALSPAIIRHVMINNADKYQRGVMTKNTVRVWGGDGILTSEGETWRRQRRLMEPWFQRRNLDQFSAPIIAAMDRLLSEFAIAADQGRRIAVEDAFMSLTTDIVAQSLFSSDINSRFTELHEGLTRIQVSMTKIKLLDMLGVSRFLPRVRGRETKETLAKLKAIFDPIINRRREGKESKPDFLQAMLDARDDVTGKKLTDQQIYDAVFTLFLGAPESTGYALVWTMYLLARFPDVQEKLHEEVMQVVGTRRVEPSDLPKLEYMWMVLQEAMRLYPPVHSFTRDAIADDEFAGIKIRKGTTVFFPVYAIQRHEKVWEAPNDFNPERFRPGWERKTDQFAFLAFGAGPRFCVGKPFAQMEMKIALAMLMRDFLVRAADEEEIGLRGLVTLRPSKKIEVTVQRRSECSAL